MFSMLYGPFQELQKHCARDIPKLGRIFSGFITKKFFLTNDSRVAPNGVLYYG